MNIIPSNLDNWSLETINELIKLRDIESEIFDFKGTDIKDLAKHLCAFGNTHGGFLVLGIDEVKNGEIKTGFTKTGFKTGKEDRIKNEIRNQQIQLEPNLDIQINMIPENEVFFVVIQIPNNNFKKPVFVKNKHMFFVRIGSSTTPAPRNTILELFSDTKKILEDLENFKSSIIVLKESLVQTLEIFDNISSSPPNRVPKVDLSIVRANVVKCESFLREKNLFGKTTPTTVMCGMTTVLHTLDTLNSYIEGFSNSTNESIKHTLQRQVFEQRFTLSTDLEKVGPFLSELTKAIDDYLIKLQHN